ncbi:Pimeloyl-ACP methyl ester carboxylesterase [Streptosporangium subroseum]|uniref:Pimeloyl-ACP methyl ester carboxylesterase n=1 Tax=Streptosporangium subroseum TaxID=106412 RepID=A0A239P7A9_9ACTN|nr:alpha/beta hydrolase [Streptosporangium subroseum]SNT62584.1 Pimeloyl-ACP methyl ester carboxylesterase [Streptosporangium subroseum]
MINRRTFRVAIACATGVALATGVTTLASAASTHQTASAPKPTVVLVHGAWSDAASWGAVIKRLQTKGYPVAAPPTALRSLSDDSAYLASYLKTIHGPIVLVGHSYGGSVITNAATDNTNVKALVYISAFAPDEGETASKLTAKFPGTHITTDPNAQVPTALTPVPFTLANGTAGVDLYTKADKYRDLFLSNRLSSKAAAELAATQRPAAPAALDGESGKPAWKIIPSWYLVSNDDHLIPPATESFMAARAHAHTVKADTPHAAQVTNPEIVTNLIEQAAATTR